MASKTEEIVKQKGNAQQRFGKWTFSARQKYLCFIENISPVFEFKSFKQNFSMLICHNEEIS